MAKVKERTINPAQQQRKKEKQKALQKGKAEVTARRTEKLARRNPERLQRQIEELQALSQSGELRPHQKKQLEELERDVKAVRKARDTLGDKAPSFGRASGGDGIRGDREAGRGGGRGGLLGKRRRDGDRTNHQEAWEGDDSDDSVSSSVKNIPMPRDTPPPIPPEILAKYRRNRGDESKEEGGGPRQPHALPPKPAPVQAKTTYESAPQIRDLRKEATNAFMPSAVRRKIESQKGSGKLLEPEEMDKLEREGYLAAGATKSAVISKDVDMELDEEERRFRRDVKGVELEEVSDEDG